MAVCMPSDPGMVARRRAQRRQSVRASNAEAAYTYLSSANPGFRVPAPFHSSTTSTSCLANLSYASLSLIAVEIWISFCLSHSSAQRYSPMRKLVATHDRS